jgi:hypothetical protein
MLNLESYILKGGPLDGRAGAAPPVVRVIFLGPDKDSAVRYRRTAERDARGRVVFEWAPKIDSVTV